MLPLDEAGFYFCWSLCLCCDLPPRYLGVSEILLSSIYLDSIHDYVYCQWREAGSDTNPPPLHMALCWLCFGYRWWLQLLRRQQQQRCYCISSCCSRWRLWGGVHPPVVPARHAGNLYAIKAIAHAASSRQQERLQVHSLLLCSSSVCWL